MDGYINADFTDIPGYTDLAFDAQQPWPFPRDTFQEVHASHVFEHLPNYRGFLDAAWDATQEDGVITLRMPHGANACAWMDITHVRPWYPLSFVCFQPGYHEASRNGQYKEEQRYFEITQCLVVVSPQLVIGRRFQRHAWWQRAFMKLVTYFPHLCEELHVTLRPLKSQAAVQRFLDSGRAGSLEVLYYSTVGNLLYPIVGSVQYMGANPGENIARLQEVSV
jgi:hypothetical protein